MKISAIIPTWNEALAIAGAVERARATADEIIVADGGSPDRTAERAAAAGAIVVNAPKGRGGQLGAGAARASGDVLLFLHADVQLAPGARAAIEAALADPDAIGGNFHLRFEDDGSLAARVFTLANHWRREWLQIYYGDSAIFVRAAAYAALGGFRTLPIFEDYEFVRRLEAAGRTVYLRDAVVVASARRFSHAPWRTLGVWTALQILFSLGVSAERLARFYADSRPKPPPPCGPAGLRSNEVSEPAAPATSAHSCDGCGTSERPCPLPDPRVQPRIAGSDAR